MKSHPCETCRYFLPKPKDSTRTNRCNLYKDINPTFRCLYHKEKPNHGTKPA